MPALIEYLIKLSICLAVVYLFYQLFLRRLTFYNWNRWYLLGYSALSFIIPLINIMPQLQKREISEAPMLSWIPAWGYSATPQTKHIFEDLTYWDWSMMALAAGCLLFLIKFLVKLFSFLMMKKKAQLVSNHQTKLYELNDTITPFSFGNAIFINRSLHSEQELEEIIRHEFVHVKQRHTVDILFCEVLCIINWYNPFAWLIRHSVKQNLEFIADDKVVQNGFDKKEYQYLLLKVMGNKQFAFTNHFNFSSLKKRIAMMNTLKTAQVHVIKFLFLLPVVAVLLLSFRKEMQQSKIPLNQIAVKDTVPYSDSGYKISVITTPGGFDNSKMERTIIERMSVEDWNKNRAFYEKKYGQTAPASVIITKKDGKETQYDSVYVTKYKPQPIDANSAPLFVIDGVPQKEGSLEALNINPADIESVTVLKGKSATSLYGDKGKKGAVQIITKEKARSIEPNVTDSLKGKVIGIVIRKNNEINFEKKDSSEGERSFYRFVEKENSLLILDGKEITQDELKVVNPNNIGTITILKNKDGFFAAKDKYGDKGKNGVIEIATKKQPVTLQLKPVENTDSKSN